MLAWPMVGTHIDSFDADVVKDIAIDRHRNRTSLAERPHMRDDEMRIESLVSRHRQCTKRQSSDAHQPTRSRMFFTSLHFVWLPSSYPDRQAGYSPLLFQ